MIRAENRIGQIYRSPKYGEYEILDICRSSKKVRCLVRFLGTGYEDWVQLAKAIAPSCHGPKDYDLPSVSGWGIVPKGYTRDFPREARLYRSMVERCHRESFLAKNPSYRGCSIDPQWQWFRNFVVDVKVVPGYDNWAAGESVSLDKDTLVPGNRVYGPGRVCFIPTFENSLEGGARGQKKAAAARSRQVLHLRTGISYPSIAEACRATGEGKTRIGKHCANQVKLIEPEWKYVES